jgi:hypothetical protein
LGALGLLVSAGVMVCIASAPAAPARPRSARAARVLTVRDSALVKPAFSNGDTTTDVGPASGTLAGTLHFSSTVAGSVFKFTFMLATSAGTIAGSGRGRLHFGRPPYASFEGTGVVGHGSGLYLHASGSGRFSGAEDRISHDTTVQVRASLHY